MPNKPWQQLNPIDQKIRQTLRLGMSNGTFLKIEFVWGFELFNTRAYHNYETWSGGYRITDERHGVIVEKEDLDDAIDAWAKMVLAKKDANEA
jgi:hypothetical protein